MWLLNIGKSKFKYWKTICLGGYGTGRRPVWLEWTETEGKREVREVMGRHIS